MKPAKPSRPDPRTTALHALKLALLEGATWRYEQLVTTAVQAGATDEDIDALVHDALQALFANAEEPLTARALAHLRPPSQFRP